MSEILKNIPTREVSVTETLPDELKGFLAARETTEFVDFPLQALPEGIRGFVDTAAESLGCDPTFLILPLLTEAAAMIGNSYVLQLKPGWTEPAVLWTLIVAPSGSLKTPALKTALEPIISLQEEAIQRYRIEMADYEASHHGRAGTSRKGSERNETSETRKRPTCPRYFCSDTTIEALALRLEEEPRGLLLYRDEISGWLRGFDRYSNSKGGEVALWLETHSAGQILVDRKTGDNKTILVSRAAVSITGGIQPDVLRKCLTPEFFENGLAPRMLMTMPPTRVQKWSDASLDNETKESLRQVFQRIRSFPCTKDEHGTLTPIVTTMSPAAKDLWTAFFDEHAQEMTQLEGSLGSLWSKLHGTCARLALIHHLVTAATDLGGKSPPTVIGARSMESAITMTRWFSGEVPRIYTVLNEGEESRRRRQLVKFIQSRGGSITANELRRSSRKYTSRENAEQALSDLVNGNLGRWVSRKTTSRGGRPTSAFVLDPRLLPFHASAQSRAAESPDSGKCLRNLTPPTSPDSPTTVPHGDDSYTGDAISTVRDGHTGAIEEEDTSDQPPDVREAP